MKIKSNVTPQISNSKIKPPLNTEKKQLTLQEEIQLGVKLKKVDTIEKTGIEYLKKGLQ